MPLLSSAAQTASATGCPAGNVRRKRRAAYNFGAETFYLFLTDVAMLQLRFNDHLALAAVKLDLQLVLETGNPQSHYDNTRFSRSYSWWNRNVYLELHRA